MLSLIKSKKGGENIKEIRENKISNIHYLKSFDTLCIDEDIMEMITKSDLVKSVVFLNAEYNLGTWYYYQITFIDNTDIIVIR